MNNLDEGSTIIGEDESEQKGIAGLNELQLLEHELKEDDSVDHYIPLQCFMEDDVRKYTPKLKLNHEGEAPAVPDTTLYSPKEGESADNSSTLETALEIPDNTEEEVPLKTTNGADNLQSCEGNTSGTDFVSKEMDIADQGTDDIKTTEDDMINKNGLDPAQNEEEDTLVSEEASDLKDESNEEDNVVEQNGEGSSEEETNKESEPAVETHDSEEVASQLEMESSVSTEALQSEMESSVLKEASQSEMESSVLEEASQPEMESSVLKEASQLEMESGVPEEACQSEMESNPPEEASQSEMESNTPEEASQSEMESNTPEEASQSEVEGSVPEEALEMETENSVPEEALEMEAEDSVPKEASQSEMETSIPEESEEAGNSPSAQDENATGAAEDMLHDALPPEDEKTEFKENTTSTDMVNTSNPVPDKPPLSPVFKLSSSSEAKKAKEINKPVIITARIVTNDGEVTTNTTNTCIVIDKNTEHSLKTFRLVKVSPVKTKAADNCGVSDITSTEDTVSNIKSAESDEKKHMSDEAKGEETKTEVQSDDAVNVTVSPQTFILTKKVYGNSKKSPLNQEKKLTSTEASSTDKQEDHCNTDEDKDVNMDSGVKVSRKSKVLAGKTSSNTRAKSVLEDSVGGSCTEKGHTDFAGVKRKFEEISRKSRQEEEDATKEIKKMKKETLDILKKINGEMKKLKSIFLAGN